VKLAEWFRENHLNRYLKPTDLVPYRKLRSATAKALYGFLDKRGYSVRARQYRAEVRMDLLDLRERFRLAARDTKELLREFRNAHAELVAVWPVLREATIEKLAPGRYECIYRFTNQTEMPLPENSEGETPVPLHAPTDPLEALTEALVSRGVTRGVAKRLVRDHAPEAITGHLDVHDQEIATGVRMENPGGRLHRRIADGWEPFAAYRPPAEREALAHRRTEYRGRREREETERKAEEQRFAALTPEAKATEKLEEWVGRRDLMAQMAGQPAATEEEQRAEYERLLSVYRQGQVAGTEA
jgi:hypothetical protein